MRVRRRLWFVSAGMALAVGVVAIAAGFAQVVLSAQAFAVNDGTNPTGSLAISRPVAATAIAAGDRVLMPDSLVTATDVATVLATSPLGEAGVMLLLEPADPSSDVAVLSSQQVSGSVSLVLATAGGMGTLVWLASPAVLIGLGLAIVLASLIAWHRLRMRGLPAIAVTDPAALATDPAWRSDGLIADRRAVLVTPVPASEVLAGAESAGAVLASPGFEGSVVRDDDTIRLPAFVPCSGPLTPNRAWPHPDGTPECPVWPPAANERSASLDPAVPAPSRRRGAHRAEAGESQVTADSATMASPVPPAMPIEVTDEGRTPSRRLLRDRPA